LKDYPNARPSAVCFSRNVDEALGSNGILWIE
jgi:hypothetical protein